jgi:carboxyl-terminal processing protease
VVVKLEQKTGRKDSLILILITSLLTFFLTSAGFVGLKYLNPEMAIRFDGNVVDYSKIQKFDEIRRIMNSRFYQDFSENDLIEGAIVGMVDSLNDPYTVYYTKQEMQDFVEKSSGSYAGIGVTVRPENGSLLVIDTFLGSPAREVGILPGDTIMKVDDLEIKEIKDSDLVINMIKGQQGTEVKISVLREGEVDLLHFDVRREVIKIDNIYSEVLPGKIGYIKILLFDSDVAPIFKNHLERLLIQDISALIVDVRDNPGGSYLEVVSIADRLLPRNLIVYTEDKNGKREERHSMSDELGLPMAVLINENSASASEILAGSLRDNKKAFLVGKKTFGKGLVQEIVPLEDGSGVKITTAKYYTPSGETIDKVGIQPDVEVSMPAEYIGYPVSQVPREADLQLNSAMELLIED